MDDHQEKPRVVHSDNVFFDLSCGTQHATLMGLSVESQKQCPLKDFCSKSHDEQSAKILFNYLEKRARENLQLMITQNFHHFQLSQLKCPAIKCDCSIFSLYESCEGLSPFFFLFFIAAVF